MSQRPSLHQAQPTRPRSPLRCGARPPSPAAPRSSLAAPFCYPHSTTPQPFYPSSTSAHPGVDRRSSIGGGAYRGGVYTGGFSPPSTGWYSTPVSQCPPVDQRQHLQQHQHQQQQHQGVAFGHPAPTARRLSLASSSVQQPLQRPAPYHQSPPGGRVQQLPTPPPARRSSLVASGENVVDSPMDRRRPKTPPDCCAVCSVTETPEWRKGPAGNRSLCNGCGLVAAKRAKEREMRGYAPPSSAAEIEHELECIGAERFKVTNGRYRLPPNTRQRIATTQERTRQQQQPSTPAPSGRARSRSKLVGHETKAAAASLLGLRRASVSTETPTYQYPTASAPRSPPSSTRGRRSGSLINQHGQHASNVGTNGGGLPPSSSYMTLPENGFGASPTFSFGRPPSSASFARPPSPSHYTLAPIASPLPRPSSVALPSGLVRPASPGISSSSSQPIAALTVSTDRMSIAHLTSPRIPSPTITRGGGQAAGIASLPTPPSTSTLRRRSASVGPSPSRSSSMSRMPTA